MFFQCLEGATETVDRLYETLLKDSRHKDIKILSRKSIDALSFSNWSMKHVALEDDMMKLLKSQGLKKFDPYKFNTEMTKSTLELLHSTNDSTETALLQVVNQKAMQPDSQIKQEPAVHANNKKLTRYVLITLVLSTILLNF